MNSRSRLADHQGQQDTRKREVLTGVNTRMSENPPTSEPQGEGSMEMETDQQEVQPPVQGPPGQHPTPQGPQFPSQQQGNLQPMAQQQEWGFGYGQVPQKQQDPFQTHRNGQSMKEQEYQNQYGQAGMNPTPRQMTSNEVAREEYERNKQRGHTDHIHFGGGFDVTPAPDRNVHQHHHHDSHHRDQQQEQEQQKLQRTLQASKQMAYQVFANVITAIEELEQREAKKQKKLKAPERSKAFIPDQSFKNYEDVVAGAEGQLIVFQAHMGHCPTVVAEQVKTEMITTTLGWGAARQDLKMPVTRVDEYALSLLEILYSGATQETFSILKKSWRLLSRSELMEGFRRIMAGQHKADKLDQDFSENPAKKAEALPIRQGQDIADGIIRYYDLAKKMKKKILAEQLHQHYDAMGGTR